MTKVLKIAIILGSTRQGRAGENVGKLVYSLAQKRKDFKVEYVDLLEWNISYINDPTPPSTVTGKYSDPKIQKWAEKIASFDGFIFVTPEYNHGYSAVLKNALDVIYKEWNNKVVGFVSYGGIVGGARSVEALRLVSIELQMVPIREALHIPIIWDAFDEKGNLKDATFEKRLESMLNQLSWWTKALKQARENN